MNSQAPSYHGYRFPPEIITHAAWLYHRVSVSFRDVEDLLAQRGHEVRVKDGVHLRVRTRMTIERHGRLVTVAASIPCD